MKELDIFTVERLEELGAGAMFFTCDEVAALARIALAAKRAEPVYQYHTGIINEEGDIDWYWVDCDKGFYSQYDNQHRRIVYTTPQLNSPEIPDGWIKFQEQKPIANQYISFVSRHGEYASGLVGEDEWVEMHDGTSFALDEIYIWLLLPPLPAAPEKSL